MHITKPRFRKALLDTLLPQMLRACHHGSPGEFSTLVQRYEISPEEQETTVHTADRARACTNARQMSPIILRPRCGRLLLRPREAVTHFLNIYLDPDLETVCNATDFSGWNFFVHPPSAHGVPSCTRQYRRGAIVASSAFLLASSSEGGFSFRRTRCHQTTVRVPVFLGRRYRRLWLTQHFLGSRPLQCFFYFDR